MSNVKLADIVNLKVEFVKKTKTTYKSKYEEGKVGYIGRPKDWKEPVTNEGNFEIHKMVKGMYQSPDWETVVFDSKKYDEFYNYEINNDGETQYTEVRWSSNERLKESVGLNQFNEVDLPAIVKFKKAEKGYTVELLGKDREANNDADFETPKVIPNETDIAPEDLPF